jgi:hypothetical protein
MFLNILPRYVPSYDRFLIRFDIGNRAVCKNVLYPSKPGISKAEQRRRAEWLLVIAEVFGQVKKDPYDDGFDEMFEILAAEAAGINMERL